LTIITQGKNVVLMFFPDVLKFFNRIGVRPVNDVTAHVTAGVTAAMDPEGMGAHTGPEAVPPVITVEMLRKREESLVHILAKTMTPAFKNDVDSCVLDEAKARRSKEDEVSARLSTIETGMVAIVCAPKKVRQYWVKADHPEMPKNISGHEGHFSWKKSKKYKTVAKHGFVTIDAAVKDMQSHIWEA